MNVGVQSEQYELAISAAFTVLSANPDHPRMKDNVNFYTSLPEAMPSYFVNLEAKPYQVITCVHVLNICRFSILC